MTEPGTARACVVPPEPASEAVRSGLMDIASLTSRRLRGRSTVWILALLALLAGACGGGGDDVADDVEQTTSTTTTTTTEAPEPELPPGPPTTRGPAPELVVEPIGSMGSITVISGDPIYHGVLGQLAADRNVVPAAALPPAPVADGISPLTGLPLADPTVASRPAIVAKVDNTSKGRPQAALSQADIVYVTEIEGGATRLAAVFHAQTPDELGPIRSGRTTDLTITGSLNSPIFLWSGGNSVHRELLRRSNLVDQGALRRNEYYRASDRPGTYNLMTSAPQMWQIAADANAGGTPPTHFEFRTDKITLPPSATPVGTASLNYPSAAASWTWDQASGVFRRSQGGEEYVDAAGVRIGAANVLIAEVESRFTGMIDTAGTRVNEQLFVGAGRGWVLSDGHLIEVTWTKPSLSSVATWTTADGIPVALLPGQTWVELIGADRTSFE